MSTTTIIHVSISGRVQGVGYRAWLHARARHFGLSGWVRNRRDGTVEAVARGPASVIERLLGECRIGPPAARVDGLEHHETAVVPLPIDFEIRPTA